MFKGARPPSPSPSMAKIDNNRLVFDIMPSLDSPDEYLGVNGIYRSSGSDNFCNQLFSDGSLPCSPRDGGGGYESTTSTSVESSPIAWLPPSLSMSSSSSRDRSSCFWKLPMVPKHAEVRDMVSWEARSQQKAEESDALELEMMKERFAKLLLGEDLSGGGKGVSSALAISNAITNLSVSVFGQLYRLEPLAEEQKARWRREMGWILSVSDYIVDFVPSVQHMPDGTITEVMVTKLRQDIAEKLPALRKLDNMLLETLDSFSTKEFQYRGEKDGAQAPRRQEEKWWLPTPSVPAGGLSADARKHLEHQKGSVNQILKAALAINAQVLSDIEVPSVYWDGLPKNARTVLGDSLYRSISSEGFSADALIASWDPKQDLKLVEYVNRVEAAAHIWQRKLEARQMHHHHGHGKDGRTSSSKATWGLATDTYPSSDQEKRGALTEKAQSLLTLLKHRFPGLPQTNLDILKIQHNKDVGHSILESYSRVLESLAFNVLSRINDILCTDDEAKYNNHSLVLPSSKALSKSKPEPHLATTQFHVDDDDSTHPPQGRSASNFVLSNLDSKELGQYTKSHPPSPIANKWANAGNINASRSPPSRD